MRSSESINERPLSIMSNGTVKSSGSKSRFNFFSSNNNSKKQKRHSISLNFSSKRSNSPSIISPTTPSFTSATMDFEELIRSGNTKKVTLTPNRLRSIEVKEEQTSSSAWDRMNGAKLTRSVSKKKSETPPPPIPPLPPLPHLNRDNSNNNNSPPLTPVSSVASRPSQKSRHSIIYEEKSEKSSLKSSSTHEDLIESQLSRNGSKLSTSSSLYSRSIQSSSEDDSTIRTKSNLIERPSSIVAKRASMGSRPPSFHEGIATVPKDKYTKRYTKDETFEPVLQPKSHPEMIYVIPATTTPKSMRFSSTISTDRSCQTDDDDDDEEDKHNEEEEWFLDEEDFEDDITEEERNMTEWLLGNV